MKPLGETLRTALQQRLLTPRSRRFFDKLDIYIYRKMPDYVYVNKNFTLTKAEFGIESEGFWQAGQPIMESQRTLFTPQRLYTLWQVAHNVAHLDLPGAEVGVYRGGSSYFIAQTFKSLLGHEVPFYSFDTFEGHPAASIDTSIETQHTVGLFSETSYEDVKQYLAPFQSVQVIKGVFPDSAQNLPRLTYGYVHLDVDLYIGILEGLRYFAPLMAVGGVIIVDDYGAKACPGVHKAVSEYLAETDLKLQPWHFAATEQMILIRQK